MTAGQGNARASENRTANREGQGGAAWRPPALRHLPGSRLCCDGAWNPDGAAASDPPMPILLLSVLVVLDGTSVTAARGGGSVRVAAGTVLEERGPARGASVPVTLEGAVALAGVVRKDRTGCRATGDVELAPLRPGGLSARLRRGAMVRPLRTRGELMEVETAGPLVLRGTIPARACAAPGTPYADETPAEGDLVLLARDTELRDGPDGPLKLRLPAGTRFNARERREGWAGGRTDGPVQIAGWVRVADLGGAPVGSPIDVLGQPLDHTHEILAPADVFASRTARRPTALRLGGGAPITVVETQADRIKVRTVGAVVAEGWVEAVMVREVTTSEESIALPAGAARRTPPRRGPRLLVP